MSRAKNFDGSSAATAVGVYAVDEMAITDQWKIMGGLRYDLFDADFQPLRGPDPLADRRGAEPARRAGVPAYQGADLLLLLRHLVQPLRGGPRARPQQPSTEPEKNETFELGAKSDPFDGALGVRTAVFRTYKNNARTTDPVLGIQVTDGKQRVQGFEFEVVGRVLPGWNVFLGYAYLDSRVLASLDVQNGVPVEGKRLANVPEHSASLWTTYDITSQWQVGGGAFFVDKRYANTDNLNVVPSYVRGDVTVAYRPIKPLELRFNVINISDEKYFDAIHPSHVIPGNARTFLLIGTWRF